MVKLRDTDKHSAPSKLFAINDGKITYKKSDIYNIYIMRHHNVQIFIIEDIISSIVLCIAGAVIS